MKLTKEQLDRFWEKVDVRGHDDCWEWQACKSSNGYGNFGVNGKVFLSHRISYMIAYGDISEGLFVCHKCDNKGCVNPNHLFLGTNYDNMQDMIKKGRNNTKLTRKDIGEIRALYKEGKMNSSDLSKMFNVQQPTIKDILKNKTWKDDNYEYVVSTEEKKYLWRITNQDKVEIKQLYKSGIYNQREIGEIYGISQAMVSYIINDK